MSRSKQAIRRAWHRLGLQARPADVVRALAQQAVLVSEDLVRRVRIELLKEVSGRPGSIRLPLSAPRPVRRLPRGFPRRGS
ncbi:MAG TPA: hypothetical protein VNK04_20820 [Gemmataceae bacterium]|nr:hypothetical protein [Gemmataceae bacterium]